MSESKRYPTDPGVITVHLGQFTRDHANAIAGRLEEAGIVWWYTHDLRLRAETGVTGSAALCGVGPGEPQGCRFPVNCYRLRN